MALQVEIIPLYDRVVVRRPDAEETRGKLIIPDVGKEKPQEAEVLAVGEGRVTDSGEVVPLTVRVGDTVLFGKYSGTDIELRGIGKITVLSEAEIVAVVKRSGEEEPAEIPLPPEIAPDHLPDAPEGWRVQQALKEARQQELERARGGDDEPPWDAVRGGEGGDE